jgi:isopentenyl phosphate kinase
VIGKTKDKLIVLKLGGSTITNKKIPKTPNLTIINRLATEIADANVAPLIIVHGGGSFGHPIAKEYKIKEGYREESQLVGFSKTHQAMLELNKLVLDALINCNIPAVPVTPSSCIVTKDGRIQILFSNAIEMMLQNGFVPLLFGDAILDNNSGFTIVSGDQLVAALATRFKANKVILGVDVDGLHTTDPKNNQLAKRFSRINMNKLKSFLHNIEKAEGSDVTGGMFGKISEMINVAKAGIRIIITNASKEKNILKALKGEEVEGTLIER